MSKPTPLCEKAKRHSDLQKPAKPHTGRPDRPVYDVLNGKRRRRRLPL